MPIIDKGKTIISRNPEITAYEIAVANGFVGIEAQWLESLIATPTYKVYSALLTQTGTDAPVATVLENTLGVSIVWEYIDVGDYTVNGITWDPLKTTIEIGKSNNFGYITPFEYFSFGIHNTNEQLLLQSGTIDNDLVLTLYNGILYRNLVEIRVYP